MVELLVIIGASGGVVLIALLAANVLFPSICFWPPQIASRQSIIFWSFFRTLNICALAIAIVDWRPLDLEETIRVAAACFALGCAGTYLWACVHLGSANLYGARNGLVTDGIYSWSRNPQYAIAMPAYAALAIAAGSAPLTILAALLILVFLLMAMSEEPWLEAAYGGSYLAYKSQVPRFYNVRRGLSHFRPAPRGGPSAG